MAGEAGQEVSTNAVCRCWACSVLVQIPPHPRDSTKLATEFKCGWCKAITRSSPPVLHSRTSRCMRCAAPVLSYAAVTIVIGLLASGMTVGYFAVLPNLFLQTHMLFIQRLIVLVICFNITFNFVGCSLRSPGVPSSSLPVASDAEDGGEGVPQGFYNDYQYCYMCEGPKPPDAHHCRICGKCILDMDHHCPFIGNCVGRANLRSFLIFLSWVLVGCIYGFIMTGSLIMSKLETFSIAKARFRGPHILRIWILDLDVVPMWYLLTLYIFCVSLGAAIGVGILLSSQIVQVSKGQNYIASLKGAPAGDKGTAYSRMKRICGGRNPLFWMLPLWDRPEQYKDFGMKIS